MFTKNENYKIIDKKELSTIKCSINIRINKELSEEEINKISLKIKKELEKKFTRIFMLFYLEGMKVGCGAYASSIFEENENKITIYNFHLPGEK